ncbi:hypothetical protein OKA05_00635 [Luteolibacter arcticus]|uniref:Phage tail protein n=1 Tax=Luteolibacter arcticus TaxID=1581411 RepID=A0ABT3GBN4_9BACT|nr:hypothetical protein [Luteolibacter arcticus]MCW1921038.1 hypothetical protein [Luteolibacter arcticus]
MNESTDRVYTMPSFYDGPREGIADFLGRPHLYRSLWTDIDRSQPGIFELIPIDEQTLALALEDWEIWLRWERAYLAGETSQDTHPALPADKARDEELKLLLEPRFAVESLTATTATADFDWPSADSPDPGTPCGVRWTVVNRPAERITVEYKTPG